MYFLYTYVFVIFILQCHSFCNNNLFCTYKYNTIRCENQCDPLGTISISPGDPTHFCCINNILWQNVECSKNGYCYCICYNEDLHYSSSEVGDPHFRGFRGQLIDAKIKNKQEAYVSILEDCVFPIRINQYWYTHILPNSGIGRGGQWIESTFLLFEEQNRNNKNGSKEHF